MKKILGELINLKLVREEDAKFIVNLRQDENLNSYISQTSSSLENQIEWIKKYLEREEQKKEFYFIVEDKSATPCGTVRIYNIQKEEVTWGSFMLNSERPDGASYEVIELSSEFISKNLGIKKMKLDVRKDNKKAIHIYEKSKFKRISEDDLNFYYERIV